jgi:hypothetical protein
VCLPCAALLAVPVLATEMFPVLRNFAVGLGGSGARQAPDEVDGNEGPPEVEVVGERRGRGRREVEATAPVGLLGDAAPALQKRPRAERLDMAQILAAQNDAFLLARLMRGKHAAWWNKKASDLLYVYNSLQSGHDFTPADVAGVRADVREITDASAGWWKDCNRDALAKAWIEDAKVRHSPQNEAVAGHQADPVYGAYAGHASSARGDEPERAARRGGDAARGGG